MIMKNNLEDACDFPLQIGASSTTGYGDGYYNPAVTSGLRGASRFGGAVSGDNAGSVYLNGNNAPTNANANYGVVLNRSFFIGRNLASWPNISKDDNETSNQLAKLILVGTIYR